MTVPNPSLAALLADDVQRARPSPGSRFTMQCILVVSLGRLERQFLLRLDVYQNFRNVGQCPQNLFFDLMCDSMACSNRQLSIDHNV